MEETLTFWLDNKICSGFKLCEVGAQTLALYRDKYYIIVRGAALMKGVRPLHYSKSSLPLIWKKALKGIIPVPEAQPVPTDSDDEILPVSIATVKKEQPKVKKTITPPSETASELSAHSDSSVTPVSVKKVVPPKTTGEIKPLKINQAVVSTACPYCNHKQDIPFEKGKNGKPFFTTCSKCNVDFAVRFVPVTIYQAQVAAFK